MPGALARKVRNKRANGSNLFQSFYPGTVIAPAPGVHNIDYYPETNYDSLSQLYVGYIIGVAQSFTGDGTKLVTAKFYLYKIGSPTGDIVAKLYDHTGTFSSTGTPTGSPLETSGVYDSSLLTTSPELIEFTFVNGHTVADGSYYCLSCEYSGGDSSNSVYVCYDGTTPTHSGNYSFTLNYASWTPNNGRDLIFYAISG